MAGRKFMVTIAIGTLVLLGLYVSFVGDDPLSWWQWHGDKQEVEQAVLGAINEPGGGDYAKAIDAVRRSTFPPAVKQFQIGQLIVGGIMEQSDRRSPETLEQGLRMMEDATVMPGQGDNSNVQQLRFLFERGDGTPPVTFPKNTAVAACWFAVERRQSDDRAGCIVLRRRLLPAIAG